MPLRVRVNENFRARKFFSQLRFDFIHDPVGLEHGHHGIDPNVKLDELVSPTGPGPEVVNAL